MSAKITGKVWELDLEPIDKLVLLALADHADHEGNNVRPGNDLLVAKTGLSEKTIGVKLRMFVEKGVLREVCAKTGRGNVREYSIEIGHMKRHLHFVWRDEKKAEGASTFKEGRRGKNSQTAGLEKVEASSTFSKKERLNVVRPFDSEKDEAASTFSGVERSNLTEQKVEADGRKVEADAIKVELDGCAYKEGTVMNHHEPSERESRAREAHRSSDDDLSGPNDDFNQTESSATVQLTKQEAALCAAMGWVAGMLDHSQWFALKNAGRTLAVYADATPERIIRAPDFYRSQRKFNFAPTWIARDWPQISAWIEAGERGEVRLAPHLAPVNSRSEQRRLAAEQAKAKLFGNGGSSDR